MPDSQTLLKKIEEKRHTLNKAAACGQPLFSDDIVQLSKELDDLLNSYEKTESA